MTTTKDDGQQRREMPEREMLEWVAQAQIGEFVPPGISIPRLQGVLQRIGYPRAVDGMPIDGADVSAWVRGYLAR